MNLLTTLDHLRSPRVLVLGDLMLDRYVWGSADRTSQEAPVPVLRVQRREHRLGGASNVCRMLRVLESHVTCVGVVGTDTAGDTVCELLQQGGIDARLVVRCPDRVTTLKERFVGRSGSGLPSQMLRVDCETSDAIGASVEEQLIEGILQRVAQHDVVLISDYAKGVCTSRCIRETIHAARRAGIPVLVDPGRDRDFRIYTGATLVKPNRSETEAATQRLICDPHDALQTGALLCQQLELEMAVITLDANGMALVRRDGTGRVFPTKARSVYDITGAGDMVLAMLALGFGSGLTPELSVQLANVAAGLEVDRTGVTALTREEIRAELQHYPRQSLRKQLTLEQAARLADEYRRRGKTIVLTNGCFDLLHVGHVTYLEEAASYGDVLFVALNSDRSVQQLKGPQRPIVHEADRAAMLASLGCVDHVLIFDTETPHALLAAIRPDVLVKGGDYRPEEVVGHEVVEAYGGRVQVTGIVPDVSTTSIVESVQARGSWRIAG